MRTAHDPKRLAGLLSEQNETAARMDQILLESGDPYFQSERRYMGPALGERVLVIELVAKQRAVIDDEANPDYTLARVEALTWPDALTMGQAGHYNSCSVTVSRCERYGVYRTRIDAGVDRPDAYETQQQIVMLAIADSLREGDKLLEIACDDPDFDDRASRMVTEAVRRGTIVLNALG
jgi:hypothetical protein